jgi:hypothetical protein
MLVHPRGRKSAAVRALLRNLEMPRAWSFTKADLPRAATSAFTLVSACTGRIADTHTNGAGTKGAGEAASGTRAGPGGQDGTPAADGKALDDAGNASLGTGPSVGAGVAVPPDDASAGESLSCSAETSDSSYPAYPTGLCTLGWPPPDAACSTGLTSCDGGACTDTAVDSLNCGSCGTRCSDPANVCAAGTCRQPPVILASGQDGPTWIAVDGANVYWMNSGDNGSGYPIRAQFVPVGQPSGTPSNAGAIMKVPILGGTPVVLATFLFPPGKAGQDAFVPGGIAVDSTSVYWTSSWSGEIFEVALAGGTPVTLVSGQNAPHSISVDSTHVYWANYDAVMKAPKAGGSAVALVSGLPMVSTIVVDSQSVYWSTANIPGSVGRVPLGGGNATTFASNQYGPIFLVLSGSNLCWTLACGAVCVPVAGGCSTFLPAVEQNYLASDGRYFYGWTHHSELAQVSLAGGSVSILTSTPQAFPVPIVVDDSNVYWTDSSAGTVLKMPK